MTFFFVKMPSNLIFDDKEYTEGEPCGNWLQVRHSNGVANTKLCKRKDGTWFIQNGSVRMNMKSVRMGGMKVVQPTSTGGKVVGAIKSKWFVQNKK